MSHNIMTRKEILDKFGAIEMKFIDMYKYCTSYENEEEQLLFNAVNLNYRSCLFASQSIESLLYECCDVTLNHKGEIIFDSKGSTEHDDSDD